MEPFKDLSDVDLFELKERMERASIDLYVFLAIYFFFSHSFFFFIFVVIFGFVNHIHFS